MYGDDLTPHGELGPADVSTSLAGSYYVLLGIDESATTEQVESAYFDVVAVAPPESELLGLFDEAYRILSDPLARAAYDREEGIDRPQLFVDGPPLPRPVEAVRSAVAFSWALLLAPALAGVLFPIWLVGATAAGMGVPDGLLSELVVRHSVAVLCFGFVAGIGAGVGCERLARSSRVRAAAVCVASAALLAAGHAIVSMPGLFVAAAVAVATAVATRNVWRP